MIFKIRNNIKNRLIFTFLFLTMIPLILVLGVTYFRQVKTIETATFDKLTAIRNLKVQRLNLWLTQRNADINAIANNPKLTDIEDIIDDQLGLKEKTAILSSSLEILQVYLDSYAAYRNLFVIHPETGEVLIATDPSFVGKDLSKEIYFRKALEKNDVYLQDIYYDDRIHDYTMLYASPLHCTKHKERHVIGILCAQIDLQHSLYNLLLERVGLGKTGETLIVSRDVLSLSELRWHENAPLSLRIKAEPAIRAAQGEEGIIEAKDYREENVLAAYTFIPETRWGFVCKQDLEELNQPIRHMLWEFLGILFGALVIFSIIIWRISESISKPVLAVDNVAKRFGQGDFTVRNSLRGIDDEVDSLAREFNQMADIITSKLDMQEGLTLISDSMIGKADYHIFTRDLLNALIRVTGATTAAFYLGSKETGKYEFLEGIGVNREFMPSFDMQNPEGEIAFIIKDGKIHHLSDIKENTRFIFKTSHGSFVPNEILTIPVTIQQNLAGFISLATLNLFSPESIQIIELSQTSINTALSNLISGEETKKLARDLSLSNKMLESQSKELKDKTIELEKQTEELKRASDELQEQNYELELQRREVEEANQLKSEFLSNMSHELRTPLNSIMALSKVLIMQSEEKLDQEESNYLQIIERNGKRLLGLINSILDLSKIESGKMDLDHERISSAELLRISVESLKGLADEKNIELQLTIPDSLPPIETDESKIHQILTNIIGNAIKFTEKGGVYVSASADTEFLCIDIKDTGIGIEKEMIPHIFEEFRQADGSTSRQFEGTGLGLAIAKKLILLLKGNIEVESEKGEGSIFKLRFPLKRENGSGIQLFDNEEDYKTWKNPSPKVLIVDDNEEVANTIAQHIKNEGFSPLVVNNGKEALEIAEKVELYAITLDIIMPDLDGWEVLRSLKNSPKTRNIPVIMASVADEKDTGFALGAVGFINKPVDKKVLIDEIRNLSNKPAEIMIVDDNETDRRIMAGFLQSERITPLKVSSGKECLSLLKKKIPDLLILDLMMPEMDGFSVLQKVREQKETMHLPVIIVTARDLSNKEKEQLKGKVSAIISKGGKSKEMVFREVRKIVSKLRDIKPDNTENSRILLVEDNPESVIQIKYLLEKEGYCVDIAKNGREGLDYIGNFVPDGIILDLMMPEVDGFEVLNQLRSNKSTARIPVLILTAKDLTKNDLNKLTNNNIQQLLHKGDVNSEELLFKVKLMLGSNRKGISKGNPVLNNENFTPDDQEQEKEKENYLAESRKRNSGESEKCILIVEDNPDNLITLKAIINNRWKVIEAGDGRSGLEKAGQELPDIILLDMALPELNGEKVIKLLKRNAKTQDIPVLAVTAQAMKGDRERFLKAGCDGYISKPVDPVKFMKLIDQFLE